MVDVKSEGRSYYNRLGYKKEECVRNASLVSNLIPSPNRLQRTISTASGKGTTYDWPHCLKCRAFTLLEPPLSFPEFHASDHTQIHGNANRR